MQAEILKFLQYLTDEKGKSIHTAAAYQNDLQQLLGFLTERGTQPDGGVQSWADVDEVYFRAYVAYLQSLEYVPATIARKVATSKRFLGYLAEKGSIACNPSKGFTLTKRQPEALQIITPIEIECLLQAPGPAMTPAALRDTVLLMLLCRHGLRVSEVVQLNLADIDWGAGQIRCGLASRTARDVPLTKPTLLALERYLQHGRPLWESSLIEAAVFLNQRGKRLTRQGLWLIVKRYAEKVGLAQLRPYDLRHSCAVQLLESGMPLPEVQARLGNISPDTLHAYEQILVNRQPELTIDGKPL